MGSILNTTRLVGLIGGAGLLLGATGCASGSADEASARPQIVVTTNILGDIVRNAVDDQADVDVIMPIGTDPHEFAPSAREASDMEGADLLVINGAGFEAGMADLLASVADSGTMIFDVSEVIDLRPLDAGAADDPHFWTDPDRIVSSLGPLQQVVGELDGIDADALAASVGAYADELRQLGDGIDETLSTIPDDRRVLVTNHEVFGYFAERFDFQVIGAVIPSANTSAEPSAAELERLAAVVAASGVPAIFGETTRSTQIASTLADEVGNDVEVVELFSESLGEPGSPAATYVGMMNTNAELIATALGS